MGGKRDSYVAFAIESVLSAGSYKNFIIELVCRFISSLETELNQDWLKMKIYQISWNIESGLGSLVIKGVFIDHFKLYLFDENQILAKTILFRDHYDEFNVDKIYLVADAFEEFLKVCQIKYSRYNRMR